MNVSKKRGWGKPLMVVWMMMSISFANASVDAPPNTTSILFGSCSHQDKPMPIFKSILTEPKDAFIFLGDNIYGDTIDMDELALKYKKLGDNILVKELRESTPTYAIWDDHDYGANDAGKHYPQKVASKALFLDFWQVPKDSARRSRKDGVYGSYVIGKGDKQIRVLLPDLRYQRDDLTSVGTFKFLTERRSNDMGPYTVSKGSMMGPAQWQWLEVELQKPERIKVIGSSLQVLADFTGWETWSNFDDKQRLLGLIKKHRVNGVLLISGDTHWGETSKLDTGLDYPLWDITSSGLTEEWKQVSPNKNRVGQATSKVNYGFIVVDWAESDPRIHFGLKDINGELVRSEEIRLSDISAY